MFDRPHHRRIAKVLHAFNSDVLAEAECYFGGGTAIVLSLGEYRESFDIDFLCASKDGYRILRNIVTSNGLGPLLNEQVKHLREVRADRYGIRTFLEVDGVPIKIEIVSEARIEIGGRFDSVFHVPTLSRQDMFAEKLLANADRGSDKAAMSRDIIDLAMMIDHWGDIPEQAWTKARSAYGEQIFKGYCASCELIRDRTYLMNCLSKMHMDATWVDRIPAVLGYLRRPNDRADARRDEDRFDPTRNHDGGT